MRKILLLSLLFLCTGLQVMAQSRTVKGKVLDENGEPVIGATVQVKDDGTSTFTNEAGEYELTVPQGKNELKIEYIGLETKEVALGASDIVEDVKLAKSSGQTLEGIQVYGKKIDPKTYTGSVATVTSEQIEKRPITNVIKALDGVPGIQMTSGGGQPGEDPQIMMRGMGSLSASSSPLIVVDGAIYSGSLSSINPSDVESTSLLKDATASSLYGARGANGVLLITTKRGKKSDKPQIKVDASVGMVNRMLPFYETLDTKTYYEKSYSSWVNFIGSTDQDRWLNRVLGNYVAYNVPAGEKLIDPATGKLNANAQAKYPTNNWFDELSRTGIRHQYSLSVANGDDKSDYYFSVGYNKDQGIIKNSNYDRITTLLNVNSKITKWLSSGFKISATYDDQRFFVPNNTAYVNPFFSAQMMGPIFPVYLYDQAGNLQYDADGKPRYDFGENPEFDQDRHFGKNTNVVAALQQDDRSTKSLLGAGVAYVQATFLKDFTLRTDLSLDYLNLNNTNFNNMLYGDAAAMRGAIDRALQTRFTYTFRQIATWSPSFDIFAKDHNLTVMVSHENYLLNSKVSSLSRSGFTDTKFREGGAAAVNAGSDSYEDNLALESYIGSIDYNYKRKYNFSANIRRDGTSRFATDARWGNFWSVGGGWVISQEDFLKDVSWIDQLKARLSYGIQGNENLGSGTSYYASMALYHYFPNYTNPGYRFNTWGNPDLKWESNSIINPGLDFSLFHNRLSGSLDYYSRGSNDLLYVRPYAPSTGIGGIQDNVGAMRNNGIELAVVGRAVDNKNFKWDIQLTLQRIRNKVTEVQGSSDTIYGAGSIFAKGLPFGTWFMPEFAGVQAQDEGDFRGGDELWYVNYNYDDQGNLVSVPAGSVTNDYQVANLPVNRRNIGSTWRDVEGSLANTITYKGFDLYFLFTFGLGGKFFDNTYSALMQPGNDFQGFAWHKDMERSWTPENPNTDVPRTDLGSPNIGQASSRFMVSNSFLKLQTANLGYNFSSKTLDKIGFQSARIYVSAENIWLLAGRKGLDIQQSLFGSSSFNYFPYRTIMFGVKLGL